MTQLLCKTPSIRLKDGREIDYDSLISMGLPGIVNLAGSSLLPTATSEDKANIAALPHTAGDDAQDVMLGAYNIACNAHYLDRPDLHAFTDAPAIVVGSGPSLTEYIPKLRETYGQYLIVASASAVRPLIEAGIEPHIIAPKERTRYPSWCFDICPTSVLYAGLIVVPDLPEKFTTGWCVGDSGDISRWAGCDMPIAPGPSSGTHALSVALMATTGRVFLIGMDNCGGHFAGYKGIEQRVDDSCLCYDGVTRESKWIYRVARVNMANKHQDRVTQLSLTAAIINGIDHGTLDGGKQFVIPSVSAYHQPRTSVFKSTLQRLPKDWDTLFGLTQTARNVVDTQLTKLDSPNLPLFHALLTPTVAQLSMERRLGMPDDDVMFWYREATLNIINTLTDTINEMATIGCHYE